MAFSVSFFFFCRTAKKIKKYVNTARVDLILYVASHIKSFIYNQVWSLLVQNEIQNDLLV